MPHFHIIILPVLFCVCLILIELQYNHVLALLHIDYEALHPNYDIIMNVKGLVYSLAMKYV